MEEERSMSLETNILGLPEDCISSIIALTSPQDACRCAAISTKFCSAAKSDIVWERFLPSSWEEIVSTLANSSVTFESKKDLFFHLSNHYAIEIWNGKVWCMLGPKELSIKWHDYCIPSPQFVGYLPELQPLTSRFMEMPHIEKVTAMTIEGKIKLRILSAFTHYVVYLVYVPRFYIFDYHEIRVSVSFHKEGELEELTNYIFHKEVYGHPPRMGREYVHPKKRDDGWVEVEMGDFFTGDDHQDDEVVVRMWETANYGHSSNGLILQGIEFRPKEIM